MRKSMLHRLVVGVALTGVVAGCSDGPSAPEAPVAAAVEPADAASGQIADIGADVEVTPAVVVRDGKGQPLAGQTVRFTVTRGGGTVERASATTDAEGIASAGRWTLGTSAGLNEVEAALRELPVVRFTATAVEPEEKAPSATTGAYDVTVRYVGTATTRQRQAVANAVSRWRSAITADLPQVRINSPAGSCFEAQPAINEVIDDIMLFVEFVDIDGAGKILGSAGPCYIRTESNLPIVGHLKLDAADLEKMESDGTLDDVVLHEIGHVLGIGTLWSRNSLVDGGGGDDPHFSGAHAIDAYRALGGTGNGVPVENTGSSGTRDSHWRESVFGNELMTGYIGGTPNPLSELTIASLKDLGYGAQTSAASQYTLGSVSGNLTAPIDLRGREQVTGPKYRVDRSGRTERIDIQRH